MKKRTTDHASVYTVELLAITLTLRWLGGDNRANTPIASVSWAVVVVSSIKTMKSCRQDLIMEIHQRLYGLHNGEDGLFFCGFLLMQGLRAMRMQTYSQNRHSGHKQ